MKQSKQSELPKTTEDMRAYALAWLDLATDEYYKKTFRPLTEKEAHDMLACFYSVMEWWDKFRKQQEKEFLASYKPATSFIGKHETAPWPGLAESEITTDKVRWSAKGWKEIQAESSLLGNPCDGSKKKVKK